MKKIINKIFLAALCSFIFVPIYSLELVTGNQKDKQSIRVELGDDKKTELAALKKLLEDLTKEEAKALLDLKPRISKVESEIVSVDADINKSSELKPFLLKKQAILKNLKQLYSDIETEWQEIIVKVNQHIALLDSYTKDPQYGALKFEKKSFHVLADLQELNDRIALQEENVRTIVSEKNEATLSLTHRRKKIIETEKAYKDKQKEQEQFIHKGANDFSDTEDFTFKERGILLDLQVILVQYTHSYTELRFKGEEIKLDSIVTHNEIEEKRLAALKKRRDSISRISLRIEEKDVEAAQRVVQEKQNKHFESIAEQDKELAAFKIEHKKAITTLEETLKEDTSKVTDIDVFKNWTARPTSAQEYTIFTDLGKKREQIGLLEKEIDLRKARIDFEKSEFEEHKISAEIVQSWFKIKHQRFGSNEDLSKELKNYDDHGALLQREYTVFEDKRRVSTRKLSSENETLNIIKDIEKKVLSQRSLFSSGAQYNRVLENLKISQEYIDKQIVITSKLIEVYSKLLVTVEHSLRYVKTMGQELNRVRLWHRSGGAISKEGLINLLPDIKAFISDIRTLGLSYIANFILRISSISSFSSLVKTAKGFLGDPFTLILFLAQLLFLFLLFLLIHRYILKISDLLCKVSPEMWGTYVASRIGSFFILFIYKHLKILFIWITSFIFLGFLPASDLYPTLLFYLCSIPYLIYLARKLVGAFKEFNEGNEYIFFNESFQERFIVFMRWFLYSTIVILSFREAFILATYTKSELPDILLAFYSMVVRVLLLTLVRKEDLLTFIPTKTTIWAAIWRLIDRYYYPVLLFFVIIMVMTDPHIGGYNNLVIYLIWGIIGTIVIAKIVFESYGFVRSSSIFAFFSSDGEVLKERFPFAKAFYGFGVVFLFLIFGCIGGLWIAWVWGSPISIDAVIDFFTTGRLTIALEGQFQKLSILDVMKSFSFIPLGFIFAFLIEKFLLHRIFSVLLVNPGVHNAISTISYYVVVILVVTMGLWAQGFRFLIAYLITPILFGIVWSLKEVFNDFVAYFIILVQRPLKVGDYIRIDSETQGVVRSISPRAVVLRRKKGFCLIIPNSRIIRETIVNWDYNLNFISLPDVLVNVVYAADPSYTKVILREATNSVVSVLKSPPPIIRLDNFGEYGYEFMVRGFIGPEKTLEQWDIASNVRLAIVKHLSKAGIKIAFPVRVIRLSKEDRGSLFNIDHSHDHESVSDIDGDGE